MGSSSFPHTYLASVFSFRYLGIRATGDFHSTATLSSEGARGLYGLRLMHLHNIFQTCFGPRAGQAFSLSVRHPNPNLSSTLGALDQ
ncbi:hypothetical protein NEOLEDRAFT_1065416 [Neolentinus lepideus HHB14362 ss-1]|uniref:Uncharacterized protein n=1 Tax=Neolentinus lepideus HHB14362 ss-1 TaxID=1314782 RepID=A0A165SNH9_9AGAM|nr:hypothetical protein NEOLEDRAFT_1065416 [Neolentinus lepideus HHB14362 ss-1]